MDISVVFIGVGEMRVWVERQRYTRLGSHPDGGLYRFEALDGEFTATLPVDADGLVLDYPGLFRRAFPITVR